MKRILTISAIFALGGALALAQGGVRITIKGSSFQPASVTIRTGETVTWVNSDDSDHAIVAADGLFRSDNLSPGSSFGYTFKKAGTFAYSCKLHPRERGQVVVKD